MPTTVTANLPIPMSQYDKVVLPMSLGKSRPANEDWDVQYPCTNNWTQCWLFRRASNQRWDAVRIEDPDPSITEWKNSVVSGTRRLDITFHGAVFPIIIETDFATWQEAAANHRTWVRSQTWAQSRKVRVAHTIICNNNASSSRAINQLAPIADFFDPKPVFWPTEYRATQTGTQALFDTEYQNWALRAGWSNVFKTYHDKGALVAPYINPAIVWNDPLKSAWTGFLANRLLRDINGNPVNYEASGSVGTNHNYVCPFRSDHVATLRNGPAGTNGFDDILDADGRPMKAVYLDVAMAARLHNKICYATDHGHTPGDPKAYITGVRNTLDGFADMDFIIGEGGADVYISRCDGFLFFSDTAQDWLGQSGDRPLVPYWNYMFGDRIQAFGYDVQTNDNAATVAAKIKRMARLGSAYMGRFQTINEQLMSSGWSEPLRLLQDRNAYLAGHVPGSARFKNATSYSIEGTLPAGVTFASGVFSGTPTALGSFPVRIKASNISGNAYSNSFTINVTASSADTTAPTVPSNVVIGSITQTGASVSFTASTDNVAVTQYRVFLNGSTTASATGTSSPITLSGLTASTSYAVTVRAVDAAGNVSPASTSVSFTTSAAPDTTAPTVSITAPTAGSTVSGNVTITATANDNVGVVGVQFRVDGVNVGAEDTTSPYSVSWNTTTATNAAHSITAVARDAAGNTTTSSAVSVTVNNAAPGNPPEFIGPDLTTVSMAVNTTATSINMSTRFTGATSYSLVVEPGGAPIPTGISINSSTGILTLSPTARGQTVMAVRATNTDGNTESNYIQVIVA